MDNDGSLDPLLRRTATPAGRAAGECLDPETLAAFAEGALPREQHQALALHAADCERCLALVAAMVRTTPAQTPAAERPGRRFAWRWVLPLAAATAALLLVVAVQRESTRVPSVPSSATRFEPAPPAPRADFPVEERRTPAAASADSGSRKADSAPRAGRRPEPPPASPSPAAPGLPDMKDRASKTEAAAPLAELAPPSPADTSASAPSGGVAVTAQRPGAAPARAEAPDEMRRSRSGFGFTPPVEVMAPDSSVRWRAAGPVVSRSGDGGVTWREQFTGSGVELLAGAASSDRVCWLVGRSGVVLRTIDGETWRPLRSPTTSDLTAVSAIDRDTASVTAADGRRYRTRDGGQTWLQENPPAPF